MHSSPAEVVGTGEMPVEGGGVELGEHVDLVDAAVDAVAHGHIDEPVASADGHRWLGACLGQGVQSRPCSSSQNDGCTMTMRLIGKE